MTAILASLLPIALYILALRMFDSFSLVKWKVLILCLAAGIVSGLVALLITGSFGSVLNAGGISLVPILEEILKCALPLWLVCRKKIRFMAETLIYGASAGGGFALFENIFYLMNNDLSLATSIFRGFDCTFLHIGCTAMVVTMALIIIETKKTISIPLSLLPSIILHLAHNYAVDCFVAEGRLHFAVMMLATLAVFITIFMLLFNIGEKRIYGWMDHSISIDVQTLSSIKSGNFAATKAGEYLLDVKDSFKPEVFFDMIMYVELYLDLKIEKQSLMLLRQAGFSSEEIEGKNQLHQSKLAELEALRTQIGKTGFNVLQPLVRDNI